MRRSLRLSCVALGLSFASAAWAANERHIKPSEYQELSPEDRAAAKARAKNRLSAYNETALPPDYSFPWMPVTFTLLAFGLAAPFAWRAWKTYSLETEEAAAAHAPPAPRKRTRTQD